MSEQNKQEPVATVRTWHKNGDQHAELADWEAGLFKLPDGEHTLYTTPPAAPVQDIYNATSDLRLMEMPVQEPSVWVRPNGINNSGVAHYGPTCPPGWVAAAKPYYTTPPAAQRQWVGLSEEEIDKLKHLIDWTATWSHGRFAYEIEQLLKEKNA